MTKYSYIDLFAGAGGWSVGFESAKYDHLGMYDHNPSACKTARHNFGNVVSCVDLSNPLAIDFPDADVIVGSPPCQGFSNEGKKNPNDPRNSLVWSFLDLVESKRPKAWIFENVPGFQRSYGGRYYKDVMDRLSKSDYKVNSFILNSADYGVPQVRKRFIMIGALDFKPTPPPATHSPYANMLGLPVYTSLWDAISDLPTPTMGDRIGDFQYQISPQTAYQKRMRVKSKMVHNHTAQNHSDRVLEKIRQVPQGGDMASFSSDYDENNVHYCGGYRRARKDLPSWTAYWTRGMTSIHPEQDRFLTPRECSRIQSFPDWFEFRGATIENYTQVCNAVPPLMAKAIAKHVARCLSLSSIPKSRVVA